MYTLLFLLLLPIHDSHSISLSPRHRPQLDVLVLLNIERAQRGLCPLTIDPALMASAKSHMDWMTTYCVYEHTRERVLENLEIDRVSSKAAVDSWMCDQLTECNIIDPLVYRCGYAHGYDKHGRSYWCLHLLGDKPEPRPPEQQMPGGCDSYDWRDALHDQP